jgi:hypothetical protein
VNICDTYFFKQVILRDITCRTFLIVSLRRERFLSFLVHFFMLIVLDGHPVWKHNPLHGLFFYMIGKRIIICRATKSYFTYTIYLYRIINAKNVVI